MANSLYAKMQKAGIDMSWYDKQKGNVTEEKKKKPPIKLFDGVCGLLSIYQLDKSGKLFSLTSSGDQHMLVRITKTKLKRAVFLCAHCNDQFPTYIKARSHYVEE